MHEVSQLLHEQQELQDGQVGPGMPEGAWKGWSQKDGQELGQDAPAKQGLSLGLCPGLNVPLKRRQGSQGGVPDSPRVHSDARFQRDAERRGRLPGPLPLVPMAI